MSWTSAELDKLLHPAVQFNPPIRFLQTTGHKDLLGIELDQTNIQVNFHKPDTKEKLKHLVKRTVIDIGGPSATATYAEVFSHFVSSIQGQSTQLAGATHQPTSTHTSIGSTPTAASPNTSSNQVPISSPPVAANVSLKPNTLFAYQQSRRDRTLQQLMKEAKTLNTKKYPAAGTDLLRGIVEILLKIIIDEKFLTPPDSRKTLRAP